MKKIVRQQNYLKELIETQANKFLSKTALRCLVRSAFEPLLDAPEDGMVLHRISDKTGMQGLLKRLEYSDIESYDYSDNSGNLVEKVWANTEFLCVLTHRYVAIIIWDTNTSDKSYVRYYSLYNSKFQSEPLEIIMRNSKVNLKERISTYNPDRRDNALLNASVRKLLENLEDAANDAVLGYAEKSATTLSDADYVARKHKVIAHEIRNQLSICDLYTEIIRKSLDKKTVDLKNLKNSLASVNKALKMANNSLLELKMDSDVKLSNVDLQTIINNSAELSKVYLEAKGIELQMENSEEAVIYANSDKLTAIIINLVKNASEAFQPKETDDRNGKYIKIKTEQDENAVQISISNNAEGIKNPEKIFDAGYSTKSTGNGLGLWICKKSTEEMLGELTLERSTEDFTEFVITIGKGE